MTSEEQARSLANLRLERDAVFLYQSLASIEKEKRRAAAFAKIASNERRHASIWADKLQAAGAEVPPVDGPRLRVRLIVALARLFGTRAVSDLVQALEGDEGDTYEEQAGPEVAEIAADEREHAQIWRELERPPADQARSADDIVQAERWHRSAQSGTFRASIFGISDGLVSNLSLVMGVAGAAAGGNSIVVAGIAGLLAGACSMGAGEWISMTSQRELFERQIELEREELMAIPEEEQTELEVIYRSKGFGREESKRIAGRLISQPDEALDTLVHEELGLDPDELGSPWGAAAGSFVSFAVGAFVPLAPFLVTHGIPALIASLAASFVALFLVGAAVSLLTGKGFLRSGIRQASIGAAAAVVTFVVGRFVGAATGIG